MGIYQEIQDEIIAEYEEDLEDVVKYIYIISEGENVYDPFTGLTNTTQAVYKTRCMRFEDFTGDNLDEPTKNNSMQFFILDSDLKYRDLDTNHKIEFVNESYKVLGIDRDPAKATWIISCGRLG